MILTKKVQLMVSWYINTTTDVFMRNVNECIQNTLYRLKPKSVWLILFVFFGRSPNRQNPIYESLQLYLLFMWKALHDITTCYLTPQMPEWSPVLRQISRDNLCTFSLSSEHESKIEWKPPLRSSAVSLMSLFWLRSMRDFVVCLFISHCVLIWGRWSPALCWSLCLSLYTAHKFTHTQSNIVKWGREENCLLAVFCT